MKEDLIDYANRLKKAERLKEAIRDIDYYIYIVNVSEPFPIDTKSFFTKTIETIKETKYVLTGTRFFGCVTHEQQIDVPASLLMDLAELAKKRRKLLMDELNEILK